MVGNLKCQQWEQEKSHRLCSIAMSSCELRLPCPTAMRQVLLSFQSLSSTFNIQKDYAAVDATSPEFDLNKWLQVVMQEVS